MGPSVGYHTPGAIGYVRASSSVVGGAEVDVSFPEMTSVLMPATKKIIIIKALKYFMNQPPFDLFYKWIKVI